MIWRSVLNLNFFNEQTIYKQTLLFQNIFEYSGEDMMEFLVCASHFSPEDQLK